MLHTQRVMFQSCTCLSFSPVNTTPVKSVSSVGTAVAVMSHVVEDKRQLPAVVAGYSDGAVRMFDLNHVDMMLKIHPHSAAVTALCFSADGKPLVIVLQYCNILIFEHCVVYVQV